MLFCVPPVLDSIRELSRTDNKRATTTRESMPAVNSTCTEGESPQRILVGTNRTEVDIEGVKIIQSFNADNMLKGKGPLEARTVKHALKLGIE